MNTGIVVDAFVAVYSLILTTGIIRAQVAAKRLHVLEPLSWEQTVRSLRAVKSVELQQIAEMSTHAAKTVGQHDGYDILLVVGGIEGLDRLQHNAMVLTTLAQCTRDFSQSADPEVIVQIEEYALTLRRKAQLVKLVRLFQCSDRVNKWFIQDIAVVYCRMVSQLIGLYTVAHVSRRERLIAACNW